MGGDKQASQVCPMATHSSTLAWKIPWTEGPGRLQPWGREESDMTERLHFHFSLSCIGVQKVRLLCSLKVFFFSPEKGNLSSPL